MTAPPSDPATAAAASRRRPSPGVLLLAAGLLGIVVIVVVSRVGGGDPYEVVLEAARDTVGVPLAADITADVDLGRLGELAQAEGGDASLGLGLLSGRVSLDGRVTLTDDTASVELRGRQGGLASLRLDEGRPPLARLDADLVGELPGGQLLRRAVPGVLGDGWVELRIPDRLTPSPAGLADRVVGWRDELATLDEDAVRQGWTITREDRDADGDRFRAVPDPEPAEDDPAIDVWVDDGRVTRVQLDAMPFLRTELFGVALRGGDGGLLLDLRPVGADVPVRPEPSGLVDLDGLRGLLPF